MLHNILSPGTTGGDIDIKYFLLLLIYFAIT
jgi:hypothetical protein